MLSVNRQIGFTLIELLICLAITSVILGLAIPPIGSIIERGRATAYVNWLVGSVAFTRHSAISFRTMVTLCPSSDGINCGGPWHNGSIAFVDKNQNGKRDTTDSILQRSLPPSGSGTIRWRSFRNRQFLQMTAEGLTNYQNGNFVYCSESQDPKFSRQIIINMPGRTRLAHDLDNDGLIEDRRGNPLRC